ncbi:MAG: phosphoribosylanthranilate isomerase [Verrucomicrobiales bacterium]|nr:phosphoribosylanthranilate isomerase [Verrucomicrobiales bacterium]
MNFFDQPSDTIAVKICGITQGEQARQIVALGADAVGINFWPKSKRHISFDQARPWLEELQGKVTRIGVFVNPDADDVIHILTSGAIDHAQLHGDESPQMLEKLTQQGFSVYKALGIKAQQDLDRIEAYPGSKILLDAYAPSEYGGTGEAFDWNLGRMAVERFRGEKKIILAGGLTAENIATAIEQVNPFAVDTASGVESGTPGIKDLDKVKQFIQAAKQPIS